MRSSFLNTPPLPRILEKRCGLMFETSILNLTPFNLHQRTVDTNIAGYIQFYWRSMLKVGDVLRCHRISVLSNYLKMCYIVKCHDKRKTTAFHQMIQFNNIFTLKHFRTIVSIQSLVFFVLDKILRFQT